jgi:N-acetylmuramoyl-L-alanine amidase
MKIKLLILIKNYKKSGFNMNFFFKIFIISFLIAVFLFGINIITAQPEVTEVSRRHGSRGREVEEIQQILQDNELFFGEITGFYGSQTEAAVRRFQRQNNLPITGIADAATLQAMGINNDRTPTPTEANINLLARIISAEARGEPYIGQVAVGAVIMNRIEHPSFPDTIAGVIYQSGEFSAVWNGQFDLPIEPDAFSAARDALAGWDPTGGAIYFFNPRKTNNRFLHSRPLLTTIGAHRFAA